MTMEERFLAVEDDYKDHQISKQAASSWVLSKPGHSNLWAEVAVLSGGLVVVHGDIEPLLFGRNIRKDVDPKAQIRRLVYERPDDLYFIREVEIAMGREVSEAACFDFSIELFRDELRGLIEDDLGPQDALVDILQDAEISFDSDVPRLESALADILDPTLLPMGRVPSQALLCAWAILRRLNILLEST